MATCRGCGTELPPKTWTGRDRIWCSERCRRLTLYAGTCDTCGGPTDGSNGASRAPTRCLDCTLWTPEAIILALQELAAEHGKSPTEIEGRRSGLPSTGDGGAIERFFGTWNGALLAAGLEVNQDKSQETYEAMRDSVLAGESVVSIASRYGVSTVAVYTRLRKHGTPIGSLRRAA